MTVGKSGPEVEKSGVARKEIDALWAAVMKLIQERPRDVRTLKARTC